LHREPHGVLKVAFWTLSCIVRRHAPILATTRHFGPVFHG
jgi:hypothetical protein